MSTLTLANTITYLPTGQKVIFRRADDPLKLKGVKFPTGYAAVTWLEELDQFDGIEAVRSILNSLRRGGYEFWCFYSYNPPKSVTSWVNRECAERMGRDDTRIRGFELVRDGIDWGWFPDPWRFVRMGWEPAARRLTVFEEHTANRMGPAETGRVVLEALTYADEPGGEPYYHDELVWCVDTPDAKVQMSTYRRDLGIPARPARKGADAQAQLRMADEPAGDRHRPRVLPAHPRRVRE